MLFKDTWKWADQTSWEDGLLMVLWYSVSKAEGNRARSMSEDFYHSSEHLCALTYCALFMLTYPWSKVSRTKVCSFITKYNFFPSSSSKP